MDGLHDEEGNSEMTTLRNRYTIASAALVLGAALLASAGAAQARGGGAAMGAIRATNVTTVKASTSPVVRDHRGNSNGEGGVTVTSGPPRHCGADVCVTGSNYSGFYGRVYDHRSGHHR
jgi:hypothetical protein